MTNQLFMVVQEPRQGHRETYIIKTAVVEAQSKKDALRSVVASGQMTLCPPPFYKLPYVLRYKLGSVWGA